MKILVFVLGAALAETGPSTPAPPEAGGEGLVAQPCAEAPAGMACVPGGAFWRGTDDGPKNARPKDQIWLSTYYLDLYEVTVADYDACVAAHGCAPARTLYDDFSRAKQPKVGVSWFHADAFCRALGKHLPSEAEWEKGARGADGRLHPWGAEPATCEQAIIMDARGRSCGVRKQGSSPKTGRTAEVGSRPAQLYGLFDMVGNAWEWVADWYAPSYAACGDACRGVDPKGPCRGQSPCAGFTQKLVRGGSWYWPAPQATTVFRRPHFPANKPYHHFGFRCAASSEEAARLVTPTPTPATTPGESQP